MKKIIHQNINLKKVLSKAQVRIKLPIPFISYEIPLNEVIDPQTIDTRITRLSDIKKELESAIFAVEQLQSEAQENKEEVSRLQERIRELEEDKSTAETVLKVPQESFARLIENASSKGRVRGWIEGLILGLLSGVISSLTVWVFTENIIALPQKLSIQEQPNPIPLKPIVNYED
ncbi:hypothetical protein [Okeania sp. KiyG1]|uniref:hypothetical protein n=1 Tax=Okeania sp. KiyG1 TaxID=2720165 RepID=UPI001921B206|nr:hypothetical protein [Okeania sp. KiyG1]GGA34163.1 hypothetical protein CYANOKiyG1_51430 [Okeania sp. KiyG1]